MPDLAQLQRLLQGALTAAVAPGRPAADHPGRTMAA
jgi:hypothetical protein